jgi:benzoyl-CoA reductase/2-hydroxyglutaryl-CoA dehydratase subunit BcrC/BadD/HgdB
MHKTRKIGITSTVPIEVVYASGAAVLDLNNVFIDSPESLPMVELAERRGFPESGCAWIKGIYACVHRSGVDAVIAVTQGDCSNTHALMETLEIEGIKTIPFMYPYDRDRQLLRLQVEKLALEFGVTMDEVRRMKLGLDAIRMTVAEIDRLTWQEGLVGGFENHLFHISCSDMKGDPPAFRAEVDRFVDGAKRREGRRFDIRLGYVGIPPIMSGIYEAVEAQGAMVVYNELQRQFSLPEPCDDIIDQYLRYTYPYHIRFRLDDIRTEIVRRQIDGIVHYVQAFCFRQIEDIILRRQLDVPVLTIEGNRPGKIDLRTKVRIEAFLDMLRSHKSRR